ncbi:hypothetical protein SCP_0704960 [Sparassis crispa]|uniref:Uncharacterized protein n=1 Tax=Sparassis crispa TaxID=139825 RepID=A0A401GT15_9APHY|nr:hypothetical protein SCP_0704960 [Sparassis crispa]GBE85309.1 hypothetical protein SCP_0704960 [Sparassis crispa]
MSEPFDAMVLPENPTLWLCAALSVFSFQGAYAANSFAGSSLYYATGLYPDSITTLLQGTNSAGMKVLRFGLGVSLKTRKALPSLPFRTWSPTWFAMA